MTPVPDRIRCPWAESDPQYRRYHDDEWGIPLHGDDELFERIALEAFQAGLSWLTILKRRTALREAFHGFRIEPVAGMPDSEAQRLMSDARIIRNRAKIEATISNARAALALVRDAPGALDRLLWSFAPPARSARPVVPADIPATTPESNAMSKRLRALGFRFVGPTTMYALMQATGMVDDHLADCWRASAPAR